MNKTNDPTPPAATGDTPPRRRPRYKNPNRSDRREERAALRGVLVNRRALSPEERATLARLRTECLNFEGSAREWERRAESGGFATPTGARLSPADCLARADADRKRAEDAGRRGRELVEAVNARAPFWPSFRNRRGSRHAGDGAARPCVSPLHLHGDGADAGSGGSGASPEARPASVRLGGTFVPEPPASLLAPNGTRGDRAERERHAPDGDEAAPRAPAGSRRRR